MTVFANSSLLIQALYVGYFGRAGDPEGASYWANQLAGGAITASNLAASYATQPEAIGKYAYLASPATGDPTSFINSIYQNLFDRSADPDGLSYWRDQLSKATGNPNAVGAFILDVMSGATGADNSILLGKVGTAANFTSALQATGTAWSADLGTLSQQAIAHAAGSLESFAQVAATADPQALFTAGSDNVDFNAVLVGTYVAGTQYDALAGNDTVVLPKDASSASSSGFIAGSFFNAGPGDDTVTGGDLNDQVSGGDGDDLLLGGAGNDVLEGGPGNDVLTGGPGTDTASYARSAAGVTVSLLIAGAQDTGVGIDTPGQIENLTGGSGNDTLTGDSAANVLVGNEGDDILDGGAGNDILIGGSATDTASGGPGSGGSTGPADNDGNDVLEGGLGDDLLIGGSGTDTASYSKSIAGVTVSLLLAGGQNTVGAGTDILSGFENLTGGSGNDTLTGDSGPNVLVGNSGNDALQGGLGDDVLIGGPGSDTASYAATTSGVTVNLSLTTAQDTGGAGLDTLREIENLTGGSGNDTLVGDSSANNLFGLAGDDTLVGGLGIDFFVGGPGNDRIFGAYPANTPNPNNPGATLPVLDGAIDTLAYNSIVGLTQGISVDWVNGTVTGQADLIGTDTFSRIESIWGTSLADTFDSRGLAADSANATDFGGTQFFQGFGGDDVIMGNALLELIYTDATAGIVVNQSNTAQGAGTVDGVAGGAGTDTFTGVRDVIGTSFDDVFNGSIFRDIFDGGAGGNDTFNGGGGFDSVEYDGTSASRVAIVVDLGAGIVTGAPGSTDGFIGTDTLRSIEGIRGSNFADVYNASTFTADNIANRSVNAGSGSSFNQYEGYGGADTIIGNGATQVGYFNASAAVTVIMSGQGTGTATTKYGQSTANHSFTGVSSVSGGSFNDTFVGGSGRDSFNGGAGDDILQGFGGADTLEGAAGNDTLTGGTGSDTFVFSGAFGRDTITDFQGDIISLSRTQFANFSAVLAKTQQVGADTVITLDSSNSITLLGVSATALTASQFVFV